MKHILSNLKNHKGVTLLELLISLAILGLLAVGFAAVFTPVFQLNGKAAQLNHGNAGITTQLEKVMGGEPGQSDVVTLTSGATMEITITAADGSTKTIVASGTFAVGEDHDTGAKLKVYVPTK